jgi:predicted esterase
MSFYAKPIAFRSLVCFALLAAGWTSTAFGADRPELRAYPFKTRITEGGTYDNGETVGTDYVVSGRITQALTFKSAVPFRVTFADATVTRMVTISGDAVLWLGGTSQISVSDKTAISASGGTLTVGGTGSLSLASAPTRGNTGVVSAESLVLAGGSISVTLGSVVRNACGLALSGDFEQLAGRLHVDASSCGATGTVYGVAVLGGNRKVQVSGGMLEASVSGEKSVCFNLANATDEMAVSGGAIRLSAVGASAKCIRGDGTFAMTDGALDLNISGDALNGSPACAVRCGSISVSGGTVRIDMTGNSVRGLSAASSGALSVTGGFVNTIIGGTDPSAVVDSSGCILHGNDWTGYEGPAAAVVPSTITGLVAGVCAGHDTLSTLDLSATSIREIPDSAFAGCTNLESVVLPASCKVVGTNAFAGCVKLAAFSGAEVVTVGADAFRGCVALGTVPPSVTNCGAYAFAHSGVGAVDLGGIGVAEGSFAGCDALATAANLPRDLPAALFAGCTALRLSGNQTRSLASVGAAALAGIASTNLTLSPSVALGDCAFAADEAPLETSVLWATSDAERVPACGATVFLGRSADMSYSPLQGVRTRIEAAPLVDWLLTESASASSTVVQPVSYGTGDLESWLASADNVPSALRFCYASAYAADANFRPLTVRGRTFLHARQDRGTESAVAVKVVGARTLSDQFTEDALEDTETDDDAFAYVAADGTAPSCFARLRLDKGWGRATTTPQAQDTKTFLDVRYGERRTELTEADTDQDRLLDIYLPSTQKPANGYPVVFFVHGGGFSSGDKAPTGGVGPIFNSFLAHGYAVVSINYFLYRKNNTATSSHDTFNPQINAATDEAAVDAAMALQWLGTHAGEYGLDIASLVAWGGSAGSITVLYTVFAVPPQQPAVRAIINCWGGIRDTNLITNSSIPVLTIHGDQDETVGVQYGLAIQARLEEIGSVLSQIIVMEGRGHAQYKYVADNLMDEIFVFLAAAGIGTL